MGLLTNLRDAVRPSAIATALRPPRKPGQRPPTAEAMTAPSAHERLVEYLAKSADHRVWFRAMETADSTGNTSEMIDVFSDSRDRDPRIDGLVRKRVSSMMGRPVIFQPPPGLEKDKEAQAAARLCHSTLLVKSLNFRGQMSHLMSGAVYGYAVSPIVWSGAREGEYVPHLIFEHANRFGYDRETRQLGFYKGFKGGWNIEPLSNRPDQFVAHQPMAGRSDYPWRRGAMRSCILPSFIKRNGLKYWLTLAERFGVPQIIAKVPYGTDDDGESALSTIGKVKASLANFTRYFYGVFGKEIDFEKIPASGEADAEVHKALIEWANLEMAIAILGQNLTTEVSGGSFAASETHRFVADDMHLADAVELAETITQQLCEPIVAYNMPGAPVPVCVINVGRKQVIKTEHVVQGIFSDNEARNSMGHSAKSEESGGDEYRDAPADGKVRGAPPGPAPEGDDGTEIDDPEEARREAA